MKIQPGHVRRQAMNEYADLQKFKAKVLVFLVAVLIIKWWVS